MIFNVKLKNLISLFGWKESTSINKIKKQTEQSKKRFQITQLIQYQMWLCMKCDDRERIWEGSTLETNKKQYLMSVINLSHFVVVVVVFICVVLLKWNTNTIERIVNIDKTQTNETNSTHCCEQQQSCLNGIRYETPKCFHSIYCVCCSLSTCCEQTNRIVCSNTKSINFIFLFDWVVSICLFENWNIKNKIFEIVKIHLIVIFVVFVVIDKFSKL
jgi:hypothetical protein